MKESSFRDLYRRAVGDPAPADLAPRVRVAVEARAPSHAPAAAVAVAVLLAVGIIGALIGPRIWRSAQVAPVAAPAASPAPRATTAPASYLNCTLPVVVTSSSGPPARISTEAGFVNTSTGAYARDPAADIAGLPGGGSPGSDLKPATGASVGAYSSSLHRWLPLGVVAAPDGRSYAWTKWLPEGSTTTHFQSNELHLYDLSTGTDRTLWAYAGAIQVVEWDGSGILADTVPPAGGQQLFWRIDPESGSASQQPPAVDPSRVVTQPGDESGGRLSYGTTTDHHGLVIFRIGSRATGDRELVFFQTPEGRVTIYQGTQGDATGFDPGAFHRDATGIWFSDYAAKVVWHWDSEGGLHKAVVHGLPPLPSGSNPSQVIQPVGDCL